MTRKPPDPRAVAAQDLLQALKYREERTPLAGQPRIVLERSLTDARNRLNELLDYVSELEWACQQEGGPA